MSIAPQLILHVGAPKCGSTALQSALSATPDLTDAGGTSLRYTAWRQIGGRGTALYGRELSLMARASAYGYLSWPNFGPQTPVDAVFASLDRVRRKGLEAGHLPIASCEGWISRAALFAPVLARWGHPPVDVVAFVRPVIEWNNSAFWQWGIWNVPSLDAWLHRSNLPYSFGADLEAWAQIPNVRVRFAWVQPDAVAQFGQWYGVDVPRSETRNAASSPALVGVLLRHRRLRLNGHEAATEFVVQRWCPPVAGRKLWAVMPRHVHQWRAVTQTTLAALRRIASDPDMQAVCDDPRWCDEKRHHPEILSGISPLNDPDQLAGLHAALAVGLARVALALGQSVPALPPCPAPGAPLTDWDVALVAMLDLLLARDRSLRDRVIRGSMPIFARLRAGDLLARAQDHWFSKSR